MQWEIGKLYKFRSGIVLRLEKVDIINDRVWFLKEDGPRNGVRTCCKYDGSAVPGYSPGYDVLDFELSKNSNSNACIGFGPPAKGCPIHDPEVKSAA